MARLIYQDVVTADMAPAGSTVAYKSIKGSKKVSVSAMPADVDTTGWTMIVWFRPHRRGTGEDAGPANLFFPNSLDTQPQVVTGTGLPARQIASTQILIFENPCSDDIWVQIFDITGATLAVSLAVTADY